MSTYDEHVKTFEKPSVPRNERPVTPPTTFDVCVTRRYADDRYPAAPEHFAKPEPAEEVIDTPPTLAEVLERLNDARTALNITRDIVADIELSLGTMPDELPDALRGKIKAQITAIHTTLDGRKFRDE